MGEAALGREIKVHDPSRKPRDWNLLLAPWQCGVFFRLVDSQTPTSSDGIPFRNFRDSTFFLFDSLAEARAFSEATVQLHPNLCAEIFDSAGKTQPPLLEIINPRALHADGWNASANKKRRWIAVALLVFAPLNFLWDSRTGGWLGFPTFIGFTMIFAALRLLLWNFGGKDRLAREQARIDSHLERERQHQREISAGPPQA